jgi:hypothetical protein
VDDHASGLIICLLVSVRNDSFAMLSLPAGGTALSTQSKFIDRELAFQQLV